MMMDDHEFTVLKWHQSPDLDPALGCVRTEDLHHGCSDVNMNQNLWFRNVTRTLLNL